MGGEGRAREEMNGGEGRGEGEHDRKRHLLQVEGKEGGGGEGKCHQEVEGTPSLVGVVAHQEGPCEVACL